MTPDNSPLVSIGLPTYNRAAKLRRAVASALAQDYANIELVISDNASTDETQAFCEELCARDPRVRYVRQPVNRGLTPNHHAVVEHARGEFFLFLSDDDWLDPAYVSACLAALVEHPDRAMAGGRGKYFQDGDFFVEDEAELLHEDGGERVVAYLQAVARNSTFYGVVRRQHLLRAPLKNTVGGDWLLVASIAFAGKVKRVEGVFINRRCEGSSEDLTRLARVSLGLSRFKARVPYLTLAVSIFKDIAWESAVYRARSPAARLALAQRAFRIVYARHFAPYTRMQLSQLKQRLLVQAVALKRKIFGRRVYW